MDLQIENYKDKHEYISENSIRSVVYLMDCIEGLKQIPEKYFELAIVDPPYGININMNMGRRKGERAKHAVKKWDKGIPSDQYFDELIRVSENQIIWGGNYFPLPLTGGWIFWNKNVPTDVSFADGELAWTSFRMVLKKIDHTYTGFNGMDKDMRIHPTQKPVDLYHKLLILYAKESDKILDTHLGSQSSRITAANMGFNFIGCELDKDYFDEGNKRFENAMKQQSLFTYKEQAAEQLNLL